MKGVFKFYIAKKGYGFITSSEYVDYFVHAKDIRNMKGDDIDKGQRVEFEEQITQRGKSAKNVSLID